MAARASGASPGWGPTGRAAKAGRRADRVSPRVYWGLLGQRLSQRLDALHPRRCEARQQLHGLQVVAQLLHP